MKSKNQDILEMFYIEEANNLIGQKNSGPKLKNQTVRLLKMTKLICHFYGCLPVDVHPYAKISIIAQSSLDIL